MLPIPKKLVKQGVRDMLRISDGAHERHAATAPAFCTSRRKASSADRLLSCRLAMRSRSTFRRAPSICMSATRKWRAVRRPGFRRRRNLSARLWCAVLGSYRPGRSTAATSTSRQGRQSSRARNPLSDIDKSSACISGCYSPRALKDSAQEELLHYIAVCSVSVR